MPDSSRRPLASAPPPDPPPSDPDPLKALPPHEVERGPQPRTPAEPYAVDLDPAPPPANEAVPEPPPPKPLLASEALMEDLAPVEPARRDAQRWCAGVGSGFLLIGTLPLLDLLPGGIRAALPWVVTGAITLVAAAARVTYRLRAVAMVVLGVLTGVVALQANGAALAQAAGGMGWGLSRMVSAVALAAALFFRARYRAYAGARVFLGAALALSLPFVIHTALTFPLSFGLAQVGAVVALGAVVVSLSGFMGAETTVAGAYLAPAMVAAFATDLALRALGRPERSFLGTGTSALAFLGAATVAAIGIFQILAWRFAADARRINLHSPPSGAAPPSERGEDWSMRE